MIDLISHRTLPSATLRLAAHAELVGPREAVRLGLAYEVVGVEELISTAVDRAAALDALDADAYATTKRRVTRDLVDAMTRSMSS